MENTWTVSRLSEGDCDVAAQFSRDVCNLSPEEFVPLITHGITGARLLLMSLTSLVIAGMKVGPATELMAGVSKLVGGVSKKSAYQPGKSTAGDKFFFRGTALTDEEIIKLFPGTVGMLPPAADAASQTDFHDFRLQPLQSPLGSPTSPTAANARGGADAVTSAAVVTASPLVFTSSMPSQPAISSMSDSLGDIPVSGGDHSHSLDTSTSYFSNGGNHDLPSVASLRENSERVRKAPRKLADEQEFLPQQKRASLKTATHGRKRLATEFENEATSEGGAYPIPW